MQIPYNPKYDYPEFSADTSPDGIRFYNTPAGQVPSVTTILSTLPKPGIDAWRERVGDEEADRIIAEACEIGSSMHNHLEVYVKACVKALIHGYEMPTPTTKEEQEAQLLFWKMKMYGLPDLDEVWGVEVPLYVSDLYAGRTDLVGVYLNKPSIIDYKTARNPKPVEWIENYKLQIAAYTMAHEQMFGTDTITQGVIMIAIRPPQHAYGNKGIPLQRFVMDYDELAAYKAKWVGVVENFYASL